MASSSRNESIPQLSSPQDYVRLLIEAVEWKKYHCNCEESRNILDIAKKILLSNNEYKIHHPVKREAVSNDKPCIKSVATQTVNTMKVKYATASKHFHGKTLMRPISIPLHQQDGGLKDPRIFPQILDKFREKKEIEPKGKRIKLDDGIIRSPSVDSDDGFFTDSLEDLKISAEKKTVEVNDFNGTFHTTNPKKNKLETHDFAVIHYPADPRLRRSNRANLNTSSTANQTKSVANTKHHFGVPKYAGLLSEQYPDYSLHSQLSELPSIANTSYLPYQHSKHKYEDCSIIPPNCWNYWLTYRYGEAAKQAKWQSSFSQYW